MNTPISPNTDGLSKPQIRQMLDTMSAQTSWKWKENAGTEVYRFHQEWMEICQIPEDTFQLFLDTGAPNEITDPLKVYGIVRSLRSGTPVPPIVNQDGRFVNGSHRLAANWLLNRLGETGTPRVPVIPFTALPKGDRDRIQSRMDVGISVFRAVQDIVDTPRLI